MKHDLKVGDRVQGMYSDRKGTVYQVTPSGVFVHWDGADMRDLVCYHPSLHVKPVPSAP